MKHITIETRTEDVKVVKYTCDVCGKVTAFTPHECYFCGKDLCSSCEIPFEWEWLAPGEIIGDYPDYLCDDCLRIGKSYIMQIHDQRVLHDKKEESLLNAWKRECVTHGNHTEI